MSLITRFLPSALCCFYGPHGTQDQDDSRPTTGQDRAHIVPRRPIPYSMINVPHHQPESLDDHAFRRMLTSSPACPIEATPASNDQHRKVAKSQRSQRYTPDGSFDVGYAFNAGSPMATSEEHQLGNIKQKTSRLRISKKSSRGKEAESYTSDLKEHHKDPIEDREAIMLGVSGQSTGLSDILKSRNMSEGGYDSDAEIIKTPELRTAATTFNDSLATAQQSAGDAELKPSDSMSNHEVSTQQDEAVRASSPTRLTRSSPYPSTPEKVSFTKALHLERNESPDVVLRRLSASIANGSIKAPTDHELRALKTPTTHETAGSWMVPIQTTYTASGKEPDTPQTVIRRLSDLIQSEIKSEAQRNSAQEVPETRPTSLLTHVDPALLEYLSRFSDRQSLDLALQHESDRPTAVVENDVPREGVQVDDKHTSATKSSHPAHDIRPEAGSAEHITPAEDKSIHLFNMGISTHLASKSNVTVLSPSISNNNSRPSLDSPPPIPPLPDRTSSKYTRLSHMGRAEHNRRPSDPRTRQLFEKLNEHPDPYWRESRTSVDKTRPLSRERDNASSVYSTDLGLSQSLSGSSRPNAVLNTRKNINSLAIGGRSASTEIPIRRSSRTYSSRVSAPQRSLSACETDRDGQLSAASEVISKYLDGEVEDLRTSNPDRPWPGSRHDEYIPCATSSTTITSSEAQDSMGEVFDRSGTRRLDFGGSSLRRQAEDDCRRHYSSTSLGADEKQSHSLQRSSSFMTPMKESATDMWNRAYQEARAESLGTPFLSPARIRVDEVRRSSSWTSLRLRPRSSSILKTPKSALRRSHSVGPDFQRAPPEGAVENNGGTGRLSKTMKRLSFWQLSHHRQQDDGEIKSRKLQKRSQNSVIKKRSSKMLLKRSVLDLRTAHTPPLSHYLGYWGSFPSHNRAERNGPAGASDNVLTRNFEMEQSDRPSADLMRASLKSRTSPAALAGIQNKTMSIFGSRSKNLYLRRNKSFSHHSPSHRIEKNRGIMSRIQKQYRTKSSEWRGQMISGGHRGSVSPGRPAEYPDLESLPCNGMFGEIEKYRHSSYNVDGVSSASQSQLQIVGHNFYESINNTNIRGKHQVDDDMKPKIYANNESSMWESVTFANMSGADERMKENSGRMRSSSDYVCAVPKKGMTETRATFPRTSKELKMPGAFQQD